MPKKPKLLEDKMHCLYCGDVQNVSIIEELFNQFKPEWKINYNLKHKNGR
jgi:hypothetical protein